MKDVERDGMKKRPAYNRQHLSTHLVEVPFFTVVQAVEAQFTSVESMNSQTYATDYR